MKIAAAFLLALFAQAGAVPFDSAQGRRFDAASVKANEAKAGVRLHSFPGNRFEATNVPLKQLVMIAYGTPGQLLPFTSIAGGPAWIDDDRFDVSATVGSGNPNTVADKQRMLRTLLADRFALRVHMESRTLPVYVLRLASKDKRLGPKLMPAGVDCEPILASGPGKRDRCLLYALPNGVLMLRGQTMSALANVLTQLLGRTVKDETGLTGGFDADARFDPSDLPGMVQLPANERPLNDAPALNTALREQLGLALSTSRAPVDILVVDSAEHPQPN